MSVEPTTLPADQSFMRRYRLPLMIAVPAIIILAGIWVWATGGRFVSSDDSFIQTGRVAISANISGHVTELAVHENQRVHKGDLLFRIDGNQPRAAAEAAQAGLSSAQSQLESSRALYAQRQAELAAAEQTLSFRQRDLARDRNLAASGVVSKQDLDSSAHEAEVASSMVSTARQQVAVAAANLGQAGRNPAVEQARAQLSRANYVVGDTIVRAPQDGVVTKVSQLQVGSYIQAAQPVFSLVTDEIWVEANFKEGDLAHMAPGQVAEVTVDAHPGLKLKAKVESISPGTGSSFSLLPPENATGNWVKVVQRVPVRLIFTERPPIPLQGGLSADVKVDTNHRRFGGSSQP
jgi:membrane fusion protein (multidrug efflux system)